MNKNTLSFLFFIIIVVSISSCVRKQNRQLTRSKPRLNTDNYLYLRRGKPVGILRVECNNCQMTYTVNNSPSTIDIREGNEDRFIYPKQKSYVKTVLVSHENQMIRVLAINPNGKIVSNVLDTFLRDQQSKNSYLMEYKRIKNTIVIDIFKKKP